LIESPLSIKILQGEFATGDVVLVDVDEKEESVVFKRSDRGTRVAVPQEVSA